jgi:hypothetical protein
MHHARVVIVGGRSRHGSAVVANGERGISGLGQPPESILLIVVAHTGRKI